jgi:hypothetical protein
MSLLTITPGAYRRTYRVLHIASLIGSFAALYFKHRYNRPRPTHFCPALMPPIPVPGHSAYPSGHSTQAHLMALCISAIVNAALAAPDPAVFDANLTVLAQRIARNREIAGLHYQSDSEDGAQLAQQLFNRLNLMAGMGLNSFQDAMNAAVGEW